MCRCFCNCKILHARPCCVFTVCCLLVFVIAVGFVVAYYWAEISGESEKNGNWTCQRWSCRNCEDLLEPSIKLNSTVCTNITYLSEADGFLLLVTLDESTLVNKTSTDINPVPVCFGEPYTEKLAKVCIRLHDLKATSSSLYVCSSVDISNKMHFVRNYALGCFNTSSS